MVRTVVSESESGTPFPAWLLTPSLHWGESLPSVGLYFFPPAFTENRKVQKKKKCTWASNLSKEVRPGL